MRVCAFNDCDREYSAKGYCRVHSRQLREGKPLTPIFKQFEYPVNWEFNYENLSQLLDYNINNGNLYWKIDMSPKARKGDIAGHVHCRNQYLSFCINGKAYMAHRIVYMLQASKQKCKNEESKYRTLPESGDTIHHKNGDTQDNRIENLEYRHGPHGKGVKGKDLRRENKKLRKENKRLKKKIEKLKWELK